MEECVYSVARVFRNNTVLGCRGEDTRVLVGRGIGFGRRVGQSIPFNEGQQHFLS